jgi:ribosome-binding protein aMBF1 (putative translation factor)
MDELEYKKGNGNRDGNEEGHGTADGASGKKNKAKNEKHGSQEQFRVVISDEANEQLESYWKIANEGKEPVELSKSDLANYLFCNLNRLLNDSDIKTLRAQHFDERKVLKNILKNSNEESELPAELKRALREHYGINDKDKKRIVKQAA